MYVLSLIDHKSTVADSNSYFLLRPNYINFVVSVFKLANRHFFQVLKQGFSYLSEVGG